MKIIHLNHYSHSLLTADLEQGLFDDWYARTGLQVKKYAPGLQVECWSPERSFRSERSSVLHGVTFRFFPSTMCHGFGREISIAMLTALHAASRTGPLIIHIHGMHAYHTTVVPLLFRKCPILIQHHGEKARALPLSRKLTRPFSYAGALMATRALRRSDAILVSNKQAYDTVCRIAGKHKVSVSTMGVDCDVFKPANPVAARKTLGIPADRTIALCMGSLTSNKNVALLIETVKRMRESHPELMLLIAGDGPCRRDIEEMIAANRLQERIRLLGYISQYPDPSALLGLLQTADIYLSASRSEGASVSLLEALACNLPVISTAAGNAGVVILPGRTGMIVPVNDADAFEKALRYFMHNRDRFSGMRESVLPYSWETIVERTLKLYAALQSAYYPRMNTIR